MTCTGIGTTILGPDEDEEDELFGLFDELLPHPAGDEDEPEPPRPRAPIPKKT